MRPDTARNDREQPVDLALGVWIRRKWLALAVFIAGFAGAVSLTFSLPNLYRATATVLVERQQVSEAFVRPSVTGELDTRIQTIHKQVMSRARLSDVVTRFNLYPELRASGVPLEAIVDRMRNDVEFGLSGVEQMGGRVATIAFTVSYSGRDPAAVAEVTNMLVSSYVAENSRTREQQAVRTVEFLKQQLEDTKRELDAHERRQAEFKLLHTGELPDQLEINMAALDRLNTQLRLNGEYQLRAIERRERFEQQVAAAPITGTPAGQLVKLRGQLAELRRTFSDQYPDVIRMKAEIARLESQQASHGSNGHTETAHAPDDATRRLAEQGIAQTQSQLASLKREEAQLRRLIESHEARVANAPKRQDELQQLSRDYEASKERYETFLKRYEEAQLAENLEQGQAVEQLRVLDPALPSAAPAAPNRLWLLMLGLVASLGLAFAAVVAAEKLDTSFHSVDDLRRFAAVPTLAVIRRMPTPADARGQRLKFAAMALSFLFALALIVSGAHYVGAGNEQIVRMTSRGRG